MELSIIVRFWRIFNIGFNLLKKFTIELKVTYNFFFRPYVLLILHSKGDLSL